MRQARSKARIIRVTPDDLDEYLEPCPGCGRSLTGLDAARVCSFCSYYRPPPAPRDAVIGLLGAGSYKILRRRLHRLTQKLRIGAVYAELRGLKLGETWAMELQCNFDALIHREEIVFQATHIIALTYADERLLWDARMAGKQVRLLRGRMWPPRAPGEPPKKPYEPRED